MLRLPWMKWFPTDEQRDTKHLSFMGRGLWVSLRCALWLSSSRGELTLTTDQWARELYSSKDEFLAGLAEMEDHPEDLVPDWTIEHIQDGDKQKIRVSCLSMLSFEHNRLQNSKYQSKHRSKGEDKGCIRLPISDSDSESEVRSQTKEGEEKKEGYRKNGTAQTLPESFVLTEVHRGYARRCGVTDPEFEFEKFCDRNLAKGEKYLDWDAALRNWFRNARQFNRRLTTGGGVVGYEEPR